MRLTPAETDRLLLFQAAELARRRRARGLRLNVPEATALIADAVAEAARDGLRVDEARAIGRAQLTAADVLPQVVDIVRQVSVEATFDDGTRLVVVTEPFGLAPAAALGAVAADVPATSSVLVTNRSQVPVTVTSRYHFFEVNRHLHFDRAAAYGMHLAVPAGSSLRFPPGEEVLAPLAPIAGRRVVIGFAGLVDGPLDEPGMRERSLARAAAAGYLGASGDAR